MTQLARLLNYLERNQNGITTLEAMQHLKILRLSERCRELERLGYHLSHTPEHTENARVIRYRLLNAAPQTDSPTNPSAGRAGDRSAGAASRYKEFTRSQS